MSHRAEVPVAHPNKSSNALHLDSSSLHQGVSIVVQATAEIQGVSHIPKDPLLTSDIEILNLLHKGENIHPYMIRVINLAIAG